MTDHYWKLFTHALETASTPRTKGEAVTHPEMGCPQSSDFDPHVDFLYDLYECAQTGFRSNDFSRVLRMLDCRCQELAEAHYDRLHDIPGYAEN